MLPTKFPVNWPFSSAEEPKNIFSRRRPSWISDRNDFRYFMQVLYKSPDTSYQVSIGLSVQEKKLKKKKKKKKEKRKKENRFSRSRARRSRISDRNNFSYLWSTSHHNASYQVSSIGLLVQEKKRKIDFQDSRHLGFPIRKILAIFDLHVTLMLSTKFQINWPFGSGEEAKNRFSRGRPWRPSWISDRNEFSCFWSTSHPDAS